MTPINPIAITSNHTTIVICTSPSSSVCSHLPFSPPRPLPLREIHGRAVNLFLYLWPPEFTVRVKSLTLNLSKLTGKTGTTTLAVTTHLRGVPKVTDTLRFDFLLPFLSLLPSHSSAPPSSFPMPRAPHLPQLDTSPSPISRASPWERGGRPGPGNGEQMSGSPENNRFSGVKRPPQFSAH